MTGIRRAIAVAKGGEGGHPCGLGQLAALTFGGSALILIALSFILAIGPSQ